MVVLTMHSAWPLMAGLKGADVMGQVRYLSMNSLNSTEVTCGPFSATIMSGRPWIVKNFQRALRIRHDSMAVATGMTSSHLVYE